MNSTIVIIQARMGSSRLPGKVLKMIDDQCMIEHVVRRTRLAKRIDDVVVAVADTPADQPLVDFCRQRDWNVIVGHPTDVLQRYHRAAHRFRAKTIVRITADCPLIDPGLIDRVVEVAHQNPGLDLVSNVGRERTFPRGLDVEAFTIDAINRLHEACNDPRYREHVTLAVYENEKQFQLGQVASPEPLAYHRWTVDTEDDLQLVTRIYQHFRDRPQLSEPRTEFGMREIVDAFRLHPEWAAINSHVIQKAA